MPQRDPTLPGGDPGAGTWQPVGEGGDGVGGGAGAETGLERDVQNGTDCYEELFF